MQELISLDQQLLLWFNGSDSLFIDSMAMTLTSKWTWIPLYLSLFYLVLKNNESMRQILLIIGCAALCVVMAGTVDDMIVKPLVARPRPTHDLQIGMLVDVVNEYRGGRYGFFSAHAANTFSVAIFFSLVVRHRILTIFMVTWSLVNCWTRMYLGVHYPGDILCGLIWGAIVGTTVYAIYMRFSPNYQTMSRFISSAYTRRGYLIADIDKLLMVFSATLLYAILRACWQ